jgi:hypothetical protein
VVAGGGSSSPLGARFHIVLTSTIATAITGMNAAKRHGESGSALR